MSQNFRYLRHVADFSQGRSQGIGCQFFGHFVSDFLHSHKMISLLHVLQMHFEQIVFPVFTTFPQFAHFEAPMIAFRPFDQVHEFLLSIESDAITWDGLDDAICGVIEDPTGGEHIHRVVYDNNKLIEVVIDALDLQDDPLQIETAQEYIDFNIMGAVVAGGPVLMVLQTDPNSQNTENENG